MTESVRNRLSVRERVSYFLSRAQGRSIESSLEPYARTLAAVRRQDLSGRSDAQLRELASALRARARAGEPAESLLPQTYALAAEVSARTLGLSPFDVQILAAVVLQQGKLAQMQTGEGKTLAAAFAACLEGLAGGGVHVMTANDYLAARDAEWMSPLYAFLGLRVGCVREGMAPRERRKAYQAEVTYLTAREAGFDLLRDGLSYSTGSLVHRELNFAIVDEADFILIDEARVPLVIAGAAPPPEVDPRRVEAVIPSLKAGRDFQADRTGRRVSLTLEGQRAVQRLLGCGGIHLEEHRPVYAAVTVALHAHHLLTRDVDYIVREGQIALVDEFTGRVADRRRWPYGIQAALEAKEGLPVRSEGMVYASITVQHFIRLYPKVSALSATAVSAAGELARCYGLSTVIIPPNRPVARIDAPDRVFTTIGAKVDAVLEEIAREHRTGRPVLLGTASVKESLMYAERLRSRGIPCRVLNAANDREEAKLVAQAGMPGAVTISTNMAGRGTDIRLGGRTGRQRERIAALGGLYVIGTNRHESVRIDNQLRGRAGRQGDPGLSRFFISLEDRLVERYAIRELIPPEYLHAGAGRELTDRRVAREIARAQSIIEDQNGEIRSTLRRYSELVERQRRGLQAQRGAALREGAIPEELWEKCRLAHARLSAANDGARAHDLLVRLYLLHLDRFWADHLLLVEELKEGIHLQRFGGEDPLVCFIRQTSDAFALGLAEVTRRTALRFRGATDLDALDLKRQGLTGPSATWTYLINDNPLPAFRLSMLGAANIGLQAAAAAVCALPLLAAAALAALVSLAKTVGHGMRRRCREIRARRPPHPSPAPESRRAPAGSPPT